jgi:protocatechuate 3,4-dioxygenase beta subunit
MMSTRKLVTDDSGGYLFESLAPGTYELTFNAVGFSTQVESHIAIPPGFTATIGQR